MQNIDEILKEKFGNVETEIKLNQDSFVAYKEITIDGKIIGPKWYFEDVMDKVVLGEINEDDAVYAFLKKIEEYLNPA